MFLALQFSKLFFTFNLIFSTKNLMHTNFYLFVIFTTTIFLIDLQF